MIPNEDIINIKCRDCPDKSCATAVLDVMEMDSIFRNRYINEVKKGTNILNEGSPTSHIIYLRSGLVKEFINRPDNQEQILQIILPHSYLGLTSIFGDKVNHYSYTALTDLRLCYIDIDVFTNLVKNNGNFAYEILTSVGRESLNNFHRFIDQNHKKIYGRIADILIYFSKVIFSDNKFQIPLTRQEIADMVGTSRESTGRVLAKFQCEGIIGIHGRNIIINDIVKLEKISRYG
ncbi:MAG: Crp/Fnr family transcriptional regulator [Bacteroidales bacterium]